jgi:hypothetical protein
VLTRSWEAPVPSLGDPRQANRGINWPAIARTLLVQVLVLLVLSGAFIVYVNWSSDVAWQEFIEASTPSVADPKQHPQFPTPVLKVKGQMACPRKE